TADPGGPATISSQAYAYYMQNVPFCIFVPTAHRNLSLIWRWSGRLSIFIGGTQLAKVDVIYPFYRQG
ncbi:hypothetical protein ACRW5F_21245, partial [Escherichia coli]